MTAWTEHIKEFAKTHGITYGVAMKSPECKSAYKKGGETAPATPQEAPKKTRGRPKKVVAPAEGEDNIKMVIAEKKPRGRPKKVVAPAEGNGLLEELRKREMGQPHKVKEETEKKVREMREKELEETNANPLNSPRPTRAGGRKTLAGKGLVSKGVLTKLVAKLRADIKHHKGEGRPVDYLQACIKMLQGKMKGGATATQKGICAELRTYIENDDNLYRALSFIIHSGDKNPNKHGDNPYADPTNSYDDSAESAIIFAQDNDPRRLRKSKQPHSHTTHKPSVKKAKVVREVSPEVGARYAHASKSALAPSAEPFVPKEFAKGRGIATMPSGSRIYPLTLEQVAKLARGIV